MYTRKSAGYRPPRGNESTIARLASYFPRLVKEEDLDVLEDQWQDLLYSKESLKSLSHKVTSFWQDLRTVRDGNNREKFAVLSKFMCDLLSLPHSSACVERVFSQVNMIKSKHANRLQADTVADRLLAKQALSRQEVACYEWEPSSVLVNDVKTGKFHQRYIERTSTSGQATLHSWKPGNASSETEEPLQVFLQ